LAGLYPLDDDHRTICKPQSKRAEIHLKTVGFVRDCLQLVAPPVHPGGPSCPVVDGLGRLDLVPDLPPHLLPRQVELNACCENLPGPNPGTVAITAPHKTALALRGMGGAGKSVLATAVAGDERVRRHFTGGIFWVTVGQKDAGTEIKATALQAALAARL